MASPDEMAAYYDGYPSPDDPATWGEADSFEDAQAAVEAAKGPPPEPEPVAGGGGGGGGGGSGMDAVRLGDQVNHGGMVGPVVTGIAATVLIGYMPAACMGDPHVCPAFNGPVPHVGGTITKGSATVKIGNKPAARVADLTTCTGGGVPGQLAKGEPTVKIGDSGSGGGGAGSPGDGESGMGASGTDANESTASYSDLVPEEPVPGEPVQTVGKETHWVSIELVDDAEQPMVGETYIVRLPDGKERRGALDDKGQKKIIGFKDAGSCNIKFPNLDLEAWEKWKPGGSPEQQGASGGSPTRSAPSTPPPEGGDQPSDGTPPPPPPRQPVQPGPETRGGAWRRIRSGECVSSVAKDTGFFWKTLWEHPSNARLKTARVDPNVLLPDDALWVPEKRPREESGPSDTHHKFRRKGEPAKLRLKLLMEDKQPRANQPYTLVVDGSKKFEGVTDAEGMIEVALPGNSKRGVLTVGPEPVEFKLALGQVDPLSEMSGVQGRLNNLGYNCGSTNGELDMKTRAALKAFQRKNGLDTTGQADDATRQKLQEAHGS